MAFSAAMTTFTISVCFSRSSFCERKNTKNVRAAATTTNVASCAAQHCPQAVSGIPRAGPDDSELQVQTLTERPGCSRRSTTNSPKHSCVVPRSPSSPNLLSGVSLTGSEAGNRVGHRCLGLASPGGLAEVRVRWL